MSMRFGLFPARSEWASRASRWASSDDPRECNLCQTLLGPHPLSVRDVRQGNNGMLRLTGAGGPGRAATRADGAGDLTVPENFGRIDLKQYLQRWQASCAEIGRSGHLPHRLLELLV
jgi:hypothetical protein